MELVPRELIWHMSTWKSPVYLLKIQLLFNGSELEAMDTAEINHNTITAQTRDTSMSLVVFELEGLLGLCSLLLIYYTFSTYYRRHLNHGSSNTIYQNHVSPMHYLFSIFFKGTLTTAHCVICANEKPNRKKKLQMKQKRYILHYFVNK